MCVYVCEIRVMALVIMMHVMRVRRRVAYAKANMCGCVGERVCEGKRAL